MDVLTLLATVTLHWTNPTQLARLDDCSDSTAVCHLTAANIYRQYSTGLVILIRVHDYSGGVPLRDSLQVPDTPIASYWVRVVNAAGESYCATQGYTVGVPAVGVGPVPVLRRELYDLAGRKVQDTPRSGVYFERVTSGGKTVRRIVVLK